MAFLDNNGVEILTEEIKNYADETYTSINIGAKFFIVSSNDDFKTICNTLLLHEPACVYIISSVMNAIVSTIGASHSFGTCCKLDGTIVDYCLNQSYNKIWHFRVTTSNESDPVFSNITSIDLS